MCRLCNGAVKIAEVTLETGVALCTMSCGCQYTYNSNNGVSTVTRINN